jgi:hypothetical protein
MWEAVPGQPIVTIFDKFNGLADTINCENIQNDR